MSDQSSFSVMLNLRVDGSRKKSTLESASIDLSHDSLMNPVENSGDGGEEMRLDDLAVFQESQWISSRIGNDTSGMHHEEFEETLKASRRGRAISIYSCFAPRSTA
jgi:hypothetical protein